jgi:signal transduction histidine kinase
VTVRTANLRALRLPATPTVGDLAVAVVSFGLTLAVLASGHDSSRSIDALGVVLAAISCFPLIARRSWPLGAFVLTAAASTALAGLDYALGPPFGPTVALFFVAADDRTRLHSVRTALVVLGVFAVHVGAAASPYSGFPTSPVLFGIVVWGGAWMIGDQVRQRRRRRVELEERLRRAEQESARERRLAAAEERTRIARDLHDSAAHAINVILLQAGAARLLQEREPAAVRAALSTIEDVARETIGEIDLLVRGLREDDEVQEPQAVEPPMGLAALDTLAERYRAGGLAIDVHVDDRPRPLPRGLDQAAYRIVQESLTNAARHGDGEARVGVHYGDRALELTIANPVPAAAGSGAPTGGHGILGMQERASLLGGTLDAGRDGEGFLVRARLPYTGGEQAA